jgi:hypothetical protein
MGLNIRARSRELGETPSHPNTFRKVPLLSPFPLNLLRGFVQPGNADNPPLRSRLSTFLFLFGLIPDVLENFIEWACRVP